MKYLGVKTEGRGLVIYQSLADQLNKFITTDHIDPNPESPTGNKLVRRKGDGAIVVPTTGTERRVAVSRGEVDDKLDAKIEQGADGVRMGKHFTIEHDGSGNYSASLFLKNGEHQFEFFTNRVGKFGAYDKTNSRTLFEADRNTFKHDTNVDMSNNRITNLPTPDGPAQPATKQYVDTKFSEFSIPEVDLSDYLTQEIADNRYARSNHTHDNYLTEIPGDVVRTETMQTYVTEQIGNISIPEVNLSGYLTQDTADGRYARASHTHTSSDISDSITRIGTSASANKLVKTDSAGFLEVIHPNDSSPEKSIITKKYFDEKVGALESEVETLKREVAILKENTGKVRDATRDRWLDVAIYPNGQMPSNTTNKLAFEEEA